MVPGLRTSEVASDLVDTAVSRIHSLTGIPDQNIIPMCNYVREHERVFHLDKMIFNALYQAWRGRREPRSPEEQAQYDEAIRAKLFTKRGHAKINDAPEPAATAVDEFGNPATRDDDMGQEHNFGAFGIILFNYSRENQAL